MMEEVSNFIRGLEKPTIARVFRTIELLKEFGYKLGMPYVKPIASGLYEPRIRGKQKVRLFYVYDKSKVIILDGLLKKTEKLPNKKILRLKKLAKTLTI